MSKIVVYLKECSLDDVNKLMKAIRRYKIVKRVHHMTPAEEQEIARCKHCHRLILKDHGKWLHAPQLKECTIAEPIE